MITAKRRELFHVLSLSGGGYKGIFSLEVLKAIEENRFSGEVALSGKHGRIQDCCDAYVGTSVGAIIAAYLAIGRSPAKLLEIFHTHRDEIFPGRAGPGYWKSKYTKLKIEKLLQEIFGDRRFSDLEKPCYVSAVDVETGNTLLIGGYKGSNIHFENTLIWQAVLASISAPAYFPFQKYDFTKNDIENRDSNGWLVDGGLSANAPELLAIADLSRNFGVPLDQFFVLSVGTTSHAVDLKGPRYKPVTAGWASWAAGAVRDWILECYLRVLGRKDAANWGAVAWFINGRTSLIDLILKSQVNASVRICENILPRKQYVRLDTGLPASERIEFDDPSKHDILCQLGKEKAKRTFSRAEAHAYRVALFGNRRTHAHSALKVTIRNGQ